MRFLNQFDSFEVIANTRSGQEAIDCSRTLKPDVVIMDIEMPKMNGIEASIYIKTELPDTVIIMFSSADDDFSIFKSLASGADGYCTKRLATNLPSIIRESRHRSPDINGNTQRSTSTLSKTLSF